MIEKVTFSGMHRIFFLLLCIGFWGHTAAANTGTGGSPAESKSTLQLHAPRPDLPGRFIINLGSNYLLNAPEGMDLKVFGSRAFDIYYAQNFDIPNLKLSFVPGIGFGFDRFSFQKAVQFDYNASGELILDSLTLDAERSKFITNYIDIPLELRFIPMFDTPEKSIWIAVGGLVGYNFEAHTKLKYTEDDELKMIKRREDWNLNKFRYSVHARLGFGGFSVYYKMGLSELFQSGKGPSGFSPTVNTIGISFNGF